MQPTIKNPPLKFPLLAQVTDPIVSPKQATYYLNKKSQAKRMWEYLDNGGLRSLNINGHLPCKMSDIKNRLNSSEK